MPLAWPDQPEVVRAATAKLAAEFVIVVAVATVAVARVTKVLLMAEHHMQTARTFGDHSLRPLRLLLQQQHTQRTQNADADDDAKADGRHL